MSIDDPSPDDLERFSGEHACCPECGAEVYDDAEFCPRCGAAIGSATVSRPPVEQWWRRKWWALIVAALIIGLLALAGVLR